MTASFSFEYVRPPDRRSIFTSTLLHADARLIVLSHDIHPSSPLSISGFEVMASGYHATWFLFRGEAWDVARIRAPDGTHTGYYVDALEPIVWQDGSPPVLEPLTDLFLDLWIGLDRGVHVLDNDELSHAEQQGWVTARQATQARNTVHSLAAATAAGSFPPPEVRTWIGPQ